MSAAPPQSGPVAQLGARFHGMEEVVGSIPTRSTNQINHLHRFPFLDFVANSKITPRTGFAHELGFCGTDDFAPAAATCPRVRGAGRVVLRDRIKRVVAWKVREQIPPARASLV